VSAHVKDFDLALPHDLTLEGFRHRHSLDVIGFAAVQAPDRFL
jgi:hypothetical protein